MVTFPQLETNITLYCQNRCVECNHMIPVQPGRHIDPAVIERDLAMASRIMHSDWYSLVGGEPTLHPAVVDIIRIVRRSGIANDIVMYSNGQNMTHLPDAFYQELDQLIVTPYKLNDDQKGFITEKCARFGLPLEWHSTDFTRTFYREPFEKSRADWIYQNCWFAKNRQVIDEGYFYRCCVSPFIPKFLLGQEKEHDGLPLDGMTEETLRKYLSPGETPEICYHCLGHMGPHIGWRETDREHWMEESIS